jgi:hypothetical protein
MRRHSIGLLSLFLLALWVAIFFFGPGGSEAHSIAAACLRVGMVLAALWLAWPQIIAGIRRLPGWAIGWLVRDKNSAKNSPAASESPSPARVKRPRRRSRNG